MPWAAGSYTKGNSATGGWTGDASLGIGIEAGRHDTQDNDFATGINQCLNKDGSNSMAGNLDFGNNRPININAGTAAAPAICAGGDVNTGLFSAAADQIGIATNGVERMRFRDDGKVNIGGTTPVGLLDVYSITSTAPQLAVRGLTTGSGGSGKASIQIDVNGNGGWLIENNATGGTRALVISDNNGYGSSTVERMRITPAGDVGIATPSPGYRVQVSCNTYNKGLAISGDGTNIGAFLHFLDNGTQRNVIHWDVGGFVSGSVNSLVARSGNTGGVYLAQGGTSWVAVSDERYKKNVEDLNYGLNEVVNLRPVRFDYIDDETDNSSRLGFIAQEVKPLIPEVVGGSEELRLGLSLSELIPAIVNAIKELNAKVDALATRIEALEA